MADESDRDDRRQRQRFIESGSDTPDDMDTRIGAIVTACIVATGVDGAGVAILTDEARTRDLLHATDADAARIDELQFTLGEGPCLQAFIRGHALWEADIADHSASAGWPVFASEVLGETGVHALFAIPLFIGEARLGVLELYRRAPGPLTEPRRAAALEAARDLGQTVVTELISRGAELDTSSARPPQGPSRMLRADVHIAVGMLSVYLGLPMPDAFARLRARAYADSRSISSLAYDIVHRTVTIDDAESA